jgi:DNA-binding CsgD family transcriptional regulator
MLSSEAALTVVEVAYDLDSTTEVWLRSLSSAFVAAIDGGYAGAARHFDAREDGLQLDACGPMVGPELLELCCGRSRLVTGTQLRPAEALALAGLPHAIRYDHEVLLLVASDGSGSGWLIGAAVPELPRLSLAQRERWRRVAAHVAAAGRLRNALADALPPSDRAPKARDLSARLRAAILSELRSSCGAEHDTTDPGAAWSALASGSWSLVDVFETDGRCVVVARRNAADATDPRALTQRERAVAERVARGSSGKEIAYELGLRTPTVSQLLHNAVRKLRVTGVAQLATLVRGLGHLQLERDQPS